MCDNLIMGFTNFPAMWGAMKMKYKFEIIYS